MFFGADSKSFFFNELSFITFELVVNWNITTNDIPQVWTLCVGGMKFEPTKEQSHGPHLVFVAEI